MVVPGPRSVLGYDGVMRRGIWIAIASSALSTGVVVADKAARRGEARTPQTAGAPSKKWDGKYYVTVGNVTTGQLKCPTAAKQVYKIVNGKLAIPLAASNQAWHAMSDEDLGLCTQKPSASLCDSYRETLDKLKAAHLPTDMEVPLGELTIAFDGSGVASGELKTQTMRILDEPDGEMTEVLNELADVAVTGGSLRLDHDKYTRGKAGNVSIRTVVPIGAHRVDEACDLDITAIDYKDTTPHVAPRNGRCSTHHTCRTDRDCHGGCTTCVGVTDSFEFSGTCQ